jgi:hypothetical protein
MTEIQMWFHNRSDEQAACNALWLWGGGGVWPDISGRSLPVAASSEPVLRGLWRLGAGENREPVENFQAADQLGAGRLLVTLSLEEWRAAGQERPLQRLERDWLAPAWNALTSGTLKTLNLNLNGLLTRVTRGQHWRVWRKIRHWAES